MGPKYLGTYLLLIQILLYNTSVQAGTVKTLSRSSIYKKTPSLTHIGTYYLYYLVVTWELGTSSICNCN